MPLYFGDFLAATTFWSGEERALYLLLLGYQWSNGPLPANPMKLATAIQYDETRFMDLWQTIGAKFEQTERGLVNARLEQHRQRAFEISEKRAGAAKAGADARWGADRDSPKSRSERLAEARRKGTHTKEEWTALQKVCGDRCVICGAHKRTLHGGGLCKDHIEPIYRGGSDAIENIQPVCRQCNTSKGPASQDYRPDDWQERMRAALTKRDAKRLTKRLPNGSDKTSHALQCHPNQTKPIQSEEQEAHEGGNLQ
jgi:uncharacterized protein YdaU (DUF1376 family)